jgi:hypothetical protein
MYTKQLALQQQLWTIATTALLERAQAATERVTLIAIWAKVGTLIISDFRFVMAAAAAAEPVLLLASARDELP